MSNVYAIEITEATFAPKECPFEALPGPQPDFVRVHAMKLIGFSTKTIEHPRAYNPHLRLTLEYGVPIRTVDEVTEIRRRETSAFVTYTKVRYVEPEATLTAVVQ